MRLLGTIKIVGDARSFMFEGKPLVSYPVVFESEGNTFVADMYRSADELKAQGIAPGAVGYMEMKFTIKDGKRYDGSSYIQQKIKFSYFTLANAGVFAGNMQATEAPQAAPQAIPANTDNAPAQAGDEPF
jgi:hypothetical protein